MRKLALITAIAALITAIVSVMGALPAFAGDGSNALPFRPAVTPAQFDLCIGPDCQRPYRERRYYDRYYGRDDDWRYRHGGDWRYRRGDCRDVTVRERRGDDVIVRRERRCD
jgi:hypothetical protein